MVSFYPMDKAFVFLPAPTMVIDYSDVEAVQLKMEPNSRHSVLTVFLKKEKGEKVSKGGEAKAKTYQFGSIEKKELRALDQFLQDKKSFFKYELLGGSAGDLEEDDEEDDEEDEEFKSGGSEVQFLRHNSLGSASHFFAHAFLGEQQQQR
jgi:hypothetical protein